MDKGRGFVSYRIDGGTKILWNAPVAVEGAVADINITSAITIRLAAGKIEIFFIRGKGRCGFPEFRIDIPQVFGLAPAVRGQVGDIQVAAAVSIREIAAGEDQPLSVLGNVLCAFILVGVDIAGQAFGL